MKMKLKGTNMVNTNVVSHRGTRNSEMIYIRAAPEENCRNCRNVFLSQQKSSVVRSYITASEPCFECLTRLIVAN